MSCGNDLEGCIDGSWYGFCESGDCYGMCEYMGKCGCTGCDSDNDILGRCCAKEKADGQPKP